MSEPRIVVAHREHLWWLLSEAAQLEHMIMCQYLFAEFSLKNGTSDGLTGEQADAVTRWRETIHDIAVDEMLHLALVANLMTAIGAAPTFGRPNFPQRSGYFPAGVQMDLLPFGEQALRHFIYLERPEGVDLPDAQGFVPAAPTRAPVQADEVLPRGQEFATIGHLYRGIAHGLRCLTDRVGERAVFVGSPRAQATPELLYWPQLVAVTDLASALKAVDEIIEQGEGCAGDWRTAHFGKFLNVSQEYHDLLQRDPSFEPARPVLPVFTRQPFDIAAPQPIITDPLTLHVAELAAVAYELVLQLLNRFFTHTDETDEQLSTLIGAAISMMGGVLGPLATTLTTLPAGPPHQGSTAGFTFEVYYALGNMVPWREPAWALLYERMALLTQRCAEISDGAPEAVHQAHQRAATIAATIAAHVPAELRPTPFLVETQLQKTRPKAIAEKGRRSVMKIVVIGGTGLIGSKLVTKLKALGHEAVAAAPNTGVNTLTGEGLAEVLKGAQVVVDVSNSPSFEDAAVMEFFQTSTRNLLSYETAAGVGHHVALSIVGSERVPQSGYMRAKVAQEKLIKEGAVPYTIVHATQFFEFTKRIADEATRDNKVYLPPVLFQPIAADDVASALCKVATSSALNGTIEIAGPEAFRFDDLIRQRLAALNDPREVVADPHALYFNAELSERSIVPDDTAQLGETRFEEWLNQSANQAPAATAASAAPSSPVVLKENEFRVSEVPAGSALLVGEAAVFNVDGHLCATDAKCTHKQGPLDKGKLEGSTVTCPWHGSQFNVCTGEVLRGPAMDPVKTYRVTVDGDIGRVETDAATAANA